MSEITPTPEGTASTEQGAGESGGALPATTPATDPGTQPDAGALASQLEAANRRARDEQSKADRFKAELDKLKGASTEAQPAPTPGITLEQLRSENRRVREFLRAETELQTAFGSADPALFEDADSRFDSVEAFRAAVEESHRSTEALVASRVEAKLQEERAKLAERFGPLDLDSPDATTPTADGLPTLAQLERMSMAEMDALDAKHPGVIDRIIQTASRKEG